MTSRAERPEVRQVALASTFHDRDDVVSLPEMSGSPCPHSVTRPSRHRVDPALRTNPVVTVKDLLAHIVGVTPDAPLVDAFLGAKCLPATRNFLLASSAEVAAIRPFDQLAGRGPPGLRHRSLRAHFTLRPHQYIPCRVDDQCFILLIECGSRRRTRHEPTPPDLASALQ